MTSLKTKKNLYMYQMFANLNINIGSLLILSQSVLLYINFRFTFMDEEIRSIANWKSINLISLFFDSPWIS